MKADEFKDLILTWMPHMEDLAKTHPKDGGSHLFDTVEHPDPSGKYNWRINRQIAVWKDDYTEFAFFAHASKKGVKSFHIYVHRLGDCFQRSTPFAPIRDYPEWKGSGYKFQVVRAWF